MGGRAFAHLSPPLPTPRLSPPLYKTLSAQYAEALSSVFRHVAVPPTRPGATSHGDIDILVSQPRSDRPLEASLHVLGASIVVPNIDVGAASFRVSVAVPHPEASGSVVQVDLTTVDVGGDASTADSFDWAVLVASHGDFWRLVGASLTKFGVVVGSKGLMVRSPEIELFEKRRNGMVLSTNVAEGLEALGLERAKEPFANEEEMWKLIVKMPWFLTACYLEDTDQNSGATSRKRAKQRDGWCNFATWVRSQVDQGSFMCERVDDSQQAEKRTKMREKLLQQFSKKQEYEEMVDSWKREQEEHRRRQENSALNREHRKHEGKYADAWIEVLGYRLRRRPRRQISGRECCHEG